MTGDRGQVKGVLGHPDQTRPAAETEKDIPVQESNDRRAEDLHNFETKKDATKCTETVAIECAGEVT